MRAIDKLIFNALATGDGVVLPTFGTLNTVTDAPKQLSTRRFSAPHTRVEFTSKESANYPSIITLICDSASMPEMSARERFDQWATSNTKAGRLTIDGVGIVGSDGFTIDRQLNTALNPLRYSQVELPSYHKLRPLWLSLILIAVAGAGAYCYFGGLFDAAGKGDVEKSMMEMNTSSSVQSPKSSSAESVESGHDVVIGDTQIEPEDVIQQELQEYSESIDMSEHAGTTVYRLVAGVFSTSENAAKFIFSDPLKLGTDGYVTMPFKGGKIAVCIYSSESIKDVEQRNAQFRSQKADMWIWKDE